MKDLFDKDVEHLALEILLSAPNHLSLFAQQSQSHFDWFHITTWPHHLCISADRGTYVFYGSDPDMLTYFGTGDVIKPDTWFNHLVAVDKSCGAKEFNNDVFTEWVKEEYQEYCLKHPDRSISWPMVEQCVLDEYPTSAEIAKMLLNELDLTPNGDPVFDTYEQTWDTYTHNFLWCLHAIVWAIKQYSKLKSEVSI